MASSSRPLARADATFHRAYASGFGAAAGHAPILTLFADRLHVHGRVSTSFAILPVTFTVMKETVHVAVAIVALFLGAESSGTRVPRGVLERLRANAKAGRSRLRALRGEGRRRSATLLAECIRFLDAALTIGTPTEGAVRAFARRSGDVIDALFDIATKEELRSLEAATRRALATRTAKERSSYHVVVAGNHQARERSLGMQYFRKLIGDDERVTYAENASSVDEAVEVVAKQKFDRRLSVEFFGERTRMERDLLGDAAERALSSHRKKSRKKKR